ncbi:MAG: hypothetical protein ACLTYN_15435 [Dysosmobacter welbionis]
MDEEYMLWWFRFLNERRDGFVLLTGAEAPLTPTTARLGGEMTRHLDLLRQSQTPGLVYCGYDAGGGSM